MSHLVFMPIPYSHRIFFSCFYWAIYFFFALLPSFPTPVLSHDPHTPNLLRVSYLFSSRTGSTVTEKPGLKKKGGMGSGSFRILTFHCSLKSCLSFKRLLMSFIHLILPTIWQGDEAGRTGRWKNKSPKKLRGSAITQVGTGTKTPWFPLTRRSKRGVNGESQWMEKQSMCLGEAGSLTGIITQLTAQGKDLWTVLKKHKWAGINTLQILWINPSWWKLLESQLLA